MATEAPEPLRSEDHGMVIAEADEVHDRDGRARWIELRWHASVTDARRLRDWLDQAIVWLEEGGS